ncbi:unnamed protein product [Penicillium nalgiovense]|nr:unnamed protein product [Penicillium nalgiovense]
MKRPDNMTDDHFNAYGIEGVEKKSNISWHSVVDMQLSRALDRDVRSGYLCLSTAIPSANDPRWYIHKPFGHSSFPMDIAPLP